MNRPARGIELACLVALTALAAAPRLLDPDLVSITPDEGIHGLFAMNVAILKDFPFVGLPSVGVRNSALFIYLLAIPYAVARHPLAGVVFVAGLNVAAVALAAGWARRQLGFFAALVSGALFATSPWMVLYARNMWPPSCLAIAVVAALTWGSDWLDSARPRLLFRLVVLAFVFPQIHFSGVVGALWIAGILVLGRRGLKAGPLALGTLIGVATWAPWLYWQHAENRWTDFAAIRAAAEGKSTWLQALAGEGSYLFALATPSGFDYWFGAEAEARVLAAHPTVAQASRAASALLIAILGVAIVLAIARPRRATNLLLPWVALPLALLTLLRPAIHPQYVLIAYPAVFLLVGALAEAVVTRTGKAGAVAIAISLTAIATVNLAFLGVWREFVATTGPNNEGHFELSYRQRRATVESILADEPGRLVALAGEFSGQAPDYDFIYNFEQIRRGYTELVRDDDQLYWIDEEPGDAAPPTPGWRIVKSWRVGPSRVLHLERLPSGR